MDIFWQLAAELLIKPVETSLAIYADEGEGSELSHQHLLESLRELQFIGKSIDEQTFQVGAQFFSQLIFVGCAPHVPVTPEESEHYLRIEIPRLLVPTLFAHAQPRPVRCLHCKQSDTTWFDQYKSKESNSLKCMHCGELSAFDRLNFHKRACFAQYIIRILPVHESEAAPTDSLLNKLRNQLGIKFGFAYI